MSFGVIVCNGFDLLYLKICVIEIAWSASISKVSFEVIKVSVFMSWEEMRCSSHCIFVCLRSSLFAVCLPHPHPTGHFSILRCDFFFFLFSFCFSFVFAVLNGICEMVSYPACLPAYPTRLPATIWIHPSICRWEAALCTCMLWDGHLIFFRD